MAAPVGPGDFVECIDTDAGPECEPHPRGYRTGELCVVEEVGEDDFGPWLNCVGKVRPADYGDPYPGFDICWFRLVYRPRADLFQSLKAPPINAPARVSEDA